MQIIQVKSAGNQSQARAVQKFTILLACFIPAIVLGHLNLVAESFWLNIKKKKVMILHHLKHFLLAFL